jgi:hypothetical protein
MDELNTFREFRRGVATPSPEAQQRAYKLLTSAIAAHRGPGTPVLRPIPKRPARFALAFGALAAVTVAALFVSAPWESSRGFLERAQAALTPPADSVVHTKWDWTLTAKDSSCTVTRGPNEMWIDQRSPHRYRGLLRFSAPDPSGFGPTTPVCTLGPPVEGGGTLDTREALVFVPPTTLRSGRGGYFGPPDLVAMLRQAISDGTAHHEGRTVLDGRTVERIRVDPQFGPAPTYYYVDPETYYPMRIEEIGVAPSGVRFDSVVRYLAYEYLPGTPANRALADIRAQHPNATGP